MRIQTIVEKTRNKFPLLRGSHDIILMSPRGLETRRCNLGAKLHEQLNVLGRGRIVSLCIWPCLGPQGVLRLFISRSVINDFSRNISELKCPILGVSCLNCLFVCFSANFNFSRCCCGYVRSLKASEIQNQLSLNSRTFEKYKRRTVLWCQSKLM